MFQKAARLDHRMCGFVFAGIVPLLVLFEARESTMNEVGFHEEFTRLRLRYAALKEQVANQIELYAHLAETEGPNIEAQYMMCVGRLECQVMRLKMEVLRWKRRFELRQAYLNRGEKPDIVAIEAQLDLEFAAWREKFESMVSRLNDSKLWFDAAKMSETDTNAIRCEYLKAVKKLHPDLNKDLSEAAVNLWNQIQKAYAEQNWKQLRFLVSLVDEVVAGRESFDETPDGLAELRDECKRLETKSQEVAAQIAELKAHAPFTYLVLLEDPELLERKQKALNRKIEGLKAAIEAYEKEWNNG